MDWEAGGMFEFGMACSSGRVGISCAPETASFRGVAWGAEVLCAGFVPKVVFHWL
jgi:hypothetical protein